MFWFVFILFFSSVCICLLFSSFRFYYFFSMTHWRWICWDCSHMYVTPHKFRLDFISPWFLTFIQHSSHFLSQQEKGNFFSWHHIYIFYWSRWLPWAYFFLSFFLTDTSLSRFTFNITSFKLKMKVIYAYGMLKQFRINCSSLTQFPSACVFPFFSIMAIMISSFFWRHFSTSCHKLMRFKAFRCWISFEIKCSH